ncbi:hypothetical protein IWQ60_003342 [Tieghemiomyces parasiticus]|uniref:Uncharacterized protein n=1 Tax=Tieghemiomyces parasiticus TaxID=78921 RepID=A0A9W8AHM8_9FUNG|nr:hypothetical protein IWQ60_003342 [Tieghemiomyces parasiticus]
MSDDEFADELYGEFAAYDGDEPDATAGSEVPAPHRAHIPLTTVTTHQSASGPAHADPEPRSSADAIDDGLLTPSRP